MAAHRLATLLALAVVMVAPALSRAEVDQLSALSLEQLMLVQVTTAAKRPEVMGGVPASIQVVTNRDIRRAAPGTLPDALRLVPTLHVARFDTLGHVVSARGFNGYEQSNKLLVLIDGRSVYSPLQSGVFWDAQGVDLDDLDRIEVISGPGGTLWGANAVNGVINVISKSADQTQGARITGSVGTGDHRAAVRYGGYAGDVAYRMYAQGFTHRRPPPVVANNVRDDWYGGQIGFRADWAGRRDEVTLLGDLYRHQSDLRLNGADVGRFRLDGGNINGRWTRRLDEAHSIEFLAYYDRADREALSGLQRVDTWDTELRLIGEWGRHRVVTGGGYRQIQDDYLNLLGGFQLDPRVRTLHLYNAFIQDEFALTPSLSLTAGVRAEDGPFAAMEVMPNLRLGWTVAEGHLVWASVARAIRAPSRIDAELAMPGVLQKGGFRPERLWAAEVGWRGRPSAGTSMSLVAFHHWYDRLRTIEPAGAASLPLRYGNSIESRSYGLEATTDVQIAPWWQIGVGGTWLEQEWRLSPGSRDTSNFRSIGFDPRHQFLLRSQMEFGAFWADARLRHVGRLQRSSVPAYQELDLTLGWRAAEGLEILLVGQNLLNRLHQEMAPPPAMRAFRRAVSLTARWEF